MAVAAVVVVAVVVAVSRSRSRNVGAPREAVPRLGPGPSVADELAKLGHLRQTGVITEEEFAAQKAKPFSQ
jgi:hypothetical protein